MLQRHLLKFEGIYPPNAASVGFIRDEPIYSRLCVHTLHSREIWVKQARVVKPGEVAYKIVKARPKWDRLANKMLEPQPLEIFGRWQTDPYVPPTAENGIVPRNAYGNVELFKPEMLPKKTVHLRCKFSFRSFDCDGGLEFFIIFFLSFLVIFSGRFKSRLWQTEN